MPLTTEDARALRHKLTRLGLCHHCRVKTRGYLCGSCRLKQKERTRKYYLVEKNKLRRCRQVRAWRQKNKDRHRLSKRQDYRNAARAVFDYYGKVCACCREKNLVFLTIDHIHGGGHKHMKQIRMMLYPWLRARGFPPGFQTLCFNCNMGKKIYKECPHKTGAVRFFDKVHVKTVEG
jgi:hypothetical protein